MMKSKSLILLLLLLLAGAQSQGQPAWTIVPSGTEADLWCVHFPTSTIGYAVGDSGRILKTMDGGWTWIRQQTGSTALLQGVHFPTPDTGYAVGTLGTGVSLRTTNGGISWTQAIHSTTIWLAGVYFLTGSSGYAVGTRPGPPSSQSGILKTTNAGVSWTDESLPAGNTPANGLTAIVGYMAVGIFGDYFVYTSFWGRSRINIQSSFTWVTMPGPDIIYDYIAVDDAGYVYGYRGGPWIVLTRLSNLATWGVHFPIGRVGYVVGDSGKVFRTTNFTGSWSPLQTPVTNDLLNVWFTDSLTGVVVGRRGTILKTVSGGTTSVQQENPARASFALLQNYPNPFNPATTIRYEVPATAHVFIRVYDLLGREVATLVNETRPAGSHQVQFSALNLSSGIYFCYLQTGTFVDMKKLLVLR